jgi:hypothetical protein
MGVLTSYSSYWSARRTDAQDSEYATRIHRAASEKGNAGVSTTSGRVCQLNKTPAQTAFGEDT